jgi:NIMA (never in mitosis gene a)-related kinase
MIFYQFSHAPAFSPPVSGTRPLRPMERYDLVKLLGKGSYGRVDLARVRATGEQVAVKKVKFANMTPQARVKAQDEVKLLASLTHANIVGYKESFQERSSLYIVMEYVDGGDLEKRISQRGSSHFQEQEVLFTFVQILLALAYMHERHVMHRDLKPQNIFLTTFGIVKVGDFGVAKSLNSTADLAKTVIGTPYYLAPEIWNSKPYGAAADIWSLGAVLFELCTLKKPFEGSSSIELWQAVMRAAHAPIPAFYSGELRQLIDGMLSQNPEYRPTAEQIKRLPFVRKAIERLIEFNRNQMQAKPPSPVKVIPGRNRLLTILPVKVPEPHLQTLADEESEVPKMEFEDDFVEDEEETDPFQLLDDVTTMLEQSIAPATTAPTWNYVPSSPHPTTITPPPFLDANSHETATYKVESLRVELESELGDSQLQALYRNLQNEEDPECRQFVLEFEEANWRAVRDVRNLIYLEETFC